MTTTDRMVVGSYDSADVTFLLKDLSDVPLEQAAEQREHQMQQGGHYSESLPIEYRPTPEYRALFEELLATQARTVAAHVLALSDLILERRGPEAVLVSLARAGTPVGVLLRRAFSARHGLDVPHYSVSIIRDRGLDGRAIAYLLDRHAPEALQFVDGWTGKGTITGELRRATSALDAQVDPTLAVLADPGGATDLTPTRADLLIPSACLNSTVCGLISRTVLNARWIGPEDFHGAKVYRDFAADDVSGRFVDTIAAEFAAAADEAAALVAHARTLPPPDMRGRRTVEAIAADHGITDLNLVKPGIGETTRVLLRRVPAALLVDPSAGADLRHLRLLAADRGVPVVERAMDYAAVGLIKAAKEIA